MALLGCYWTDLSPTNREQISRRVYSTIATQWRSHSNRVDFEDSICSEVSTFVLSLSRLQVTWSDLPSSMRASVLLGIISAASIISSSTDDSVQSNINPETIGTEGSPPSSKPTSGVPTPVGSSESQSQQFRKSMLASRKTFSNSNRIHKHRDSSPSASPTTVSRSKLKPQKSSRESLLRARAAYSFLRTSQSQVLFTYSLI